MQVDEDLERRRTILTCYLVSTAASMSLRRPNSYRSNHWINDCIEFLGIHGSTSALDHILVAWAKLFQVCEDIVVAFSFDDLGNIADRDRGAQGANNVEWIPAAAACLERQMRGSWQYEYRVGTSLPSH
ncbi:hypothetical protein HYALB_00009591 [Hymenoscyphus albidus]|uniref:Uncharacterized protein n=1 Tax=Hymenoscyphus albidus TaxID=595503 RepID=A0A9N9LZL8_9HELO|nr:hypothetical protein HYALB_00009591 [Hymenoscyphus albidus]